MNMWMMDDRWMDGLNGMGIKRSRDGMDARVDGGDR